ncbi:MAG: hypothetical protein Q7K57_58550 [Burkholderiaceae bacterium]|nr:hypothetical protein [Burkholderiaceae bacterium]
MANWNSRPLFSLAPSQPAATYCSRNRCEVPDRIEPPRTVVGHPISDEDLQKLFVATLAGTFDVAVVKLIPLATSMSEVQALAVVHLELRSRTLPESFV